MQSFLTEYSHLYLAIEGRLAAVICIEDPLRPEARDVIKNLKEVGFQQDRHDDRRQRPYGESHRGKGWR